MRLNEKIYDKIHACWLGKNIGGTLGGPYEGRTERLSLSGIPDIGGNGPLPNDDLDLQLLNLHTLEQRGLYVTANDFSEEWAEHVYFPYDEYGYALANIRRNMVPPLSGCYNNPFTDCMGSPIRSELWAALSPGEPDIAAYYAYQDAMVDHAGGEGMYGEVFFAVLESFAFEENNPVVLIERSLDYLPSECRVYSAVNDTLEWYKQGVEYKDIRDKILEKYSNKNFTDAPQNIAFTIVGLLYGKDFEDAMLKTVNLGYDTDCTVATLGSILGIIYGTAGIPLSWSKSVGDEIMISPEVRGFDYPKTITELTERTVAVNRKLAVENKERFKFRYIDSFKQQNFFLPKGSGSSLDVSIICSDFCSVIPGRENTVTVMFVNKSYEEWHFKVSVSDKKDGKEHEIKLSPGEKSSIDFMLIGKINKLMCAEYRLSVTRLHDGQIWKNYNIDFILPAASKWNIDGKEKYCNGGFINFSSPGTHCASTTLELDTPRTVKLICAGTNPVKLSINDKKVLESDIKNVYLPAFHRCPKPQQTLVSLDAGRYRINIDVESTNEITKLMFLPVASDKSETSGSNYYYVDCAIGAK